MVMFGIHGSEKGFLDATDEKLSFSFNAAIDSVHRTEHDILEERDIKIERLEIKTRKLENGKMELAERAFVLNLGRKKGKETRLSIG